MSLTEGVYEAVLRAGRPLLRLAGALDAKVARGVAGRKHAVRHLVAWATTQRDAARPLLWFHSPSVGEGLMAQAIIAAVREIRPEAQIAFTFFSPSAERLAERVGADVSAYLPWDATPDVERTLRALAPSAIVFVRTEVWPVLTREAKRRAIPLALVNAVLGASSSRLRPASRLLLGPAYARLDAVGAVADEDAARYVGIGIAPDRVRVTGDARFDQVWQRVQRLDRGAPLLRALAGAAPVLLAGSTWPADEDLLIAALGSLRARERLHLVLVPHEPTRAHVARLERRLDAAALTHERLDAVERRGAATADVTVVDRVGVLAQLYGTATIAYVGGGFGRAGLHSVVEPAALGVPVLFGPRHGNAREAAELVIAGGGFQVQGAPQLADRASALLDPRARAAAAAAALDYVRSRLGGAMRNASLVLGLASH